MNALQNKPHSETKAAPVRGALLCFIAAPFIALIAGLIAAIFIGPFAIILAVAVPFIGIAIGLTARSGECPNCGSIAFVLAGKGKCRACKHRLLIKEKRLYDVTA